MQTNMHNCVGFHIMVMVVHLKIASVKKVREGKREREKERQSEKKCVREKERTREKPNEISGRGKQRYGT